MTAATVVLFWAMFGIAGAVGCSLTFSTCIRSMHPGAAFIAFCAATALLAVAAVEVVVRLERLSCIAMGVM